MTRFSLICGTAGRTSELGRLLESLCAQTSQNFELLLIDQNTDERVLEIIGGLTTELKISRIEASPGLCRALNLGLQRAEGEVIAFPDDDCWYPPDLLLQISNLFSEHSNWDGITVPTIDEVGVPSIARWGKRAGRLSPWNVGFRGCSTSVFYRSDVCQRVGLFDENVGRGGLLSPGSDVDYLQRVLRAGFEVVYQPHLHVNHPQVSLVGATSQAARQKRYSYGFGEGSIARKYSLPLWYPAAMIGFPLARAIKEAAFGRQESANREWLTFRGRLDGWLKTKAVN